MDSQLAPRSPCRRQVKTMNYAIIASDGRQLKVEEGQELLVDYRDAAAGETITFDRVLAVRGEGGLTIGRPVVEGAAVQAEVVGSTKGKKIVVSKFKRRKNYHRKQGHRQLYTKVKITGISGA